MSSFQGSIANFPILKKVIVIFLAIIVPALAIAGTIVLFFMVDWWALMLIVDFLAIMISISFSGILWKGQSISFSEDELSFMKGWSNGRIPYRNIIKVYRVFNDSKDAIFIVFNEPASKSNPNRCLTVEQIFDGKDRKNIFKKLNRSHEKYSFSIIDKASVDMIKQDKCMLQWIPV